MMPPVPASFFSYWMDPDAAARDDFEPTVFATEAVSENVVRLPRQVTILRTQVQELSATVAVLIEMLAASGQLDRAAIEARVEAVLAARCAPKPQPSVSCVRCKRAVPANKTVITGDGVMCDPKCA
ncbi:MAG: hypothetical protein ACTHU0_03350 [Kofleriaceae bacterium]